MKIISITGTKGKTTITRAISHVLSKLGEATLRVDTDGHYVNEKRKSTLEDSKKLFSLVPTVCPGKFLLDMRKYYPNFTAILEVAIGSSGKAGIGYGLHQIGIFTNVLEDHLGVTERLKTRMDIAKAKKFIFSAIDHKGFLIFNADDFYVCSQLNAIPNHRTASLLPVGYSFKFFNIKEHLGKDGECLTVMGDFIVAKSKKKIKKLINLKKIYWTFNGQLTPSVYNLMFIVGALYSNNGRKLSPEMVGILENYRMDKFGGRLIMLKNEKGVRILIDYAHEKYSLLEVATLGNKLKQNKLIGVVRLAPDRTDKMIRETGQAIGNHFDKLIVYDKLDGINRGKYIGVRTNITREVGEVSDILYRGIQFVRKDKNAERIIVEEEAIKRAAEIARKGDFVIVICGDDHNKTARYIKKYFKASFV